MRVLVTGAGGFCGRHLSRHLSTQGVEVYAAGRAPSRSGHYQVDLGDAAAIGAVLCAVKPQFVVHLAGVARAADIDAYYRVNTLYAAQLLRAMELAACTDVPLLLVGTAAEYGAVSEHELPITETTPARPADHYGISKLGQTLMGQAVGRNGRPIVIVRPFNIVGRGMPDHLSIQSFTRQIAEGAKTAGRAVIDVGNLSSTRDFVDVETVVSVYWRLLQTPAAYGEVINVCSGRPVVMREVLEDLITISGIPVDVRRVPDRIKSLDVPMHYGSPAKLHRVIGDVKWRDLHLVLEEMLHDNVANP